MNKSRLFPHIVFFWVLLISVAILNSCSPIRKYPADKFLLKKNVIRINKSNLEKDDIYSLIRQKPNKKNLGLYLNIRFWNYSKKGKENGFKRWIQRTISAEPVLYDPTLTEISVKQIGYYLNNQGYFNAAVSDTVVFKRRNAFVTYSIKTGLPYKIRNVSYQIKDATLKAYVLAHKNDCKLIKGDIYSADNIDAERERINKSLQNNGYYFFNKEFVTFLIDSNLNSREVDISIKISGFSRPDPLNPDSIIVTKHKRYTIDKIIVNTNFDLANKENQVYDTTRTVVRNIKKRNHPRIFYLVHQQRLKVNPKTLAQALYVDSNDVYNYADIEKTYKSLLDLKLYKYVSIEFVTSMDTMPSTGTLNCIIKLSRSPLQAITVSTDATHTGGELGVAAGLVYNNWNLFRGAERFGLRIKGAIEFQSFNKKNSSEKPVIEKLKFVNTIETGIDFEIKIPRFLLPVNQSRFPKNFKPKTNINGVFNYQIRPRYERFFTSGSFGYQWKANEYTTHYLTPVQINLVRIYPDSTFKAQIDALQDRILQNSYKDHITTSLTYTFLYTTQKINKTEDFLYFKANSEFAGFMFYLINAIRNRPGAYTLFDIPYSQYLRLDGDLRYYSYLNKNNLFVFRSYMGFGMPFGKNNVLPFEKSFYQGGANSMRGWRFKTLGPGSYHDSSGFSIDRIGEISMEFNIEYRFPIYKFLKGAAFVDIGNIWLRNKSENLSGAEFGFPKFLSDMAIDGGLGIRADFGYFVIRLDGAVVLKDPAMPLNQRWIGQNNQRFMVFGNFGIGYPF